MIEIEITEQMKKQAWAKSREMGVIRNSIMKGDGNIAGFLGEEVANVVIDGTISNTYDYDVVSKSGIKYDVKTKRCTSPPKPKDRLTHLTGSLFGQIAITLLYQN